MHRVNALITELAAYPGIDGCALVEAATGMVWHHAGHAANTEQIGEAAIEFWRVQERLSSQLATLGPLRSAAYSFANRVVALFPCSDAHGLVLVCIAAKGAIAWAVWAEKVTELQQALAQAAAPKK